MNQKSAAWYGGGIANLCGSQPGIGQIFYVNGSTGSNANDGLSPSYPFLTLTYAISQCTANANDYIFVLAYPNPAPVTETFPIVVSKAKVHIIGTPAQATPSPYINPPADTNAFDITASNVEIAGLEISAGATGACIATSGVIWKGNIHNNFFTWQGTGQDAIRLSAGTDDCPSWWIHENHFGSGITRDAIRITHNSTRTIIENNAFLGIPAGGIGVNAIFGAASVSILNNIFKVSDSATGEAITLAATSSDAVICGNQTGQGNVAMGNVPYRDLGASHWGINYYDIRAMMPVTV